MKLHSIRLPALERCIVAFGALASEEAYPRDDDQVLHMVLTMIDGLGICVAFLLQMPLSILDARCGSGLCN